MSKFLIKKIAEENYKFFCELNGSDYIASEFALFTILNLIQKFKIKSVLELGMGIGSVSDTILKCSKEKKESLSYYGTELNEFCLSVLPINVKYFNDVKLFDELKSIDNKTFDLIIIDGLDNSLHQIKNYVKTHTILFVEGDRSIQTQTLKSLFPKHYYVNVITLKKNPTYVHGGNSFENYLGGGQLIFINPTFLMKIYWFKEKVFTYVKRKVRKFNN
ncbi:hypothetical protein V8G56_12885 [Gaetbulibacter aquiaggeris]|uniref:Methyltransferase family protein n=1 Tax=Gaetbulibacter aquiaggeris TaxID=1735373 RepID=A0ABW7MSN6_9FLAO